MRHLPAIVSMALLTFSSFTQDREKIDSLTTIIKNEPDESKKHHHLIELANLYIHTDRAKSDSIATIALLYTEENEDIELQSEALSLLAFVNYKDEKDEIALRYYKRLDSILQANNIKNELLIKSKLYQSQIAKFTYTEEGLHRAKGYLDEMLDISKQIGSAEYEHLAYLNIGGWYGVLAQVENPDENLEICEKFQLRALKYFLEVDDTINISKAYWFMSNLSLARGNLPSAEKYMIKRLEVLKASKDSLEMANAYSGLAAFNYKVVRDFSEAILFYDTASMIYHKKGYPNSEMRLRLLNGYATSHKGKGEYQKAFSYLDRAYMLKDSLDRNRSREATVEMETKYQTEKKQQQIELLTAQNQLAEQQKETQLFVLLAISVFVLTLAVVFYILYRNRQKVTQKLQELDTMKSTFFANISHEFRTPVTLIKGPVSDQLKKTETDDANYANLSMIDRNADRLLSLVDQLLDLSKLEAGNMRLRVEAGDVFSHLSAIGSSFKYAADQKQIAYHLNIPSESHACWFDKDAVEKITVNLLSNAIKYTPEKGEIHIKCSESKGRLTISVRNTGKGINKDEVKRVLDRFYQADSTHEGAGIGLALVNELVSLHKGKLTFDSLENEFTLFEIELPVSKESFSADAITHEHSSTPDIHLTDLAVSGASANGNHKLQDDGQPILLIVEDNPDVRQLVKNIFDGEFHLLEAENGEVGIETAIETIPDIIISDVMMPVKDGIELSKTLKQDERTSHIPIVLLTAKAGEENELTGLETGVDDYIVKPFNNEILKVKVQKLIELRANLRKKYSQEIVLKPQDVAITSTDEKFLNRVQDLLDKKLADSEFTADVFSREIGMSRMQLHRKLKALVGLTTTEFIKSQRLKIATQLLKSSDANMSEVGYAVGFNDPSYFAKCFKESYGESPSAYAASHSA